MSTSAPSPPTGSATDPAATRNVPDKIIASPRWLPTSLAPTSGGAIVAYLLILFGVLFLIAEFVPLGGGVFLLGLGLAFGVARPASSSAWGSTRPCATPGSS